LADAKLYEPYHRAFTDAGHAVLVFDYRGFGRSDGSASLDPGVHIRDWLNAVAHARRLPGIDADRVGVFGSGGTGGGNAVVVAAENPDVKVVISQMPIADGRDWLRGMRSPDEWTTLLDRLKRDRTLRLQSGSGELVSPRPDIQPHSEQRRQASVKRDVDRRIPDLVPLSSVEGLIEYRPLEVARRARCLMVIAVQDDDVTPTEHAIQLYEAASAPKQLLILQNTTHYTAYQMYIDGVVAAMLAWLGRFIGSRPPTAVPAVPGILIRADG
jgi:dipeptidyl aminopeptidase/acylaminoacyl peptidase